MNFTYEKVVDENKYQVRLNGEFVCYISKDNEGWYYSDGINRVEGRNRELLMAALLYGWGFEDIEELFRDLIATHLS